MCFLTFKDQRFQPLPFSWTRMSAEWPALSVRNWDNLTTKPEFERGRLAGERNSRKGVEAPQRLRSLEWCPGEDSNLHALASAST